MSMETLDLIQGSEEWKQLRKTCLVASEAPVIMGASPHMKRDELLRLKSTGEEQEINEWVEKFVFKKGHEVEALARPIAETRIGEELYPVTGLRHIDGLKMLASFDGLTMFEDNHWEHKQFNKELYEQVQSGGELEGKHFWQLEHQLLVNGNDCGVFAVSDGTEDNYADLVYHPRPDRREQLIHGWKLFLKDLENYQPKEAKAELVGKSPMDLPALRIELRGEVAASNLSAYKEVAQDVFRAIKTDLKTDQDFANADRTVKWCESIEKKLDGAKQNALAQTADIDELFRTIDDLREEARQVRLNLSKQVEKRKKDIKLEIAQAAKAEFDKHIDTLNRALGGNYMPRINTDFNGAMKSKRTVATLESAANDECARARIEANRIASRIEQNLELFADVAEEHFCLFADKDYLLMSHEKEALSAVIKQRIADHKAAEDARIKAEAERIAALKQREAEASKPAAEPVAEPAPVHTAAATSSPRVTRNVESVRHEPLNSGRPTTYHVAKRPSDEEIIEALADRFGASKKEVVGWLMEIDLRGAHMRMASNG